MGAESPDILTLEANEENLTELARRQVLDEEALRQGLKTIGFLPSQQEWVRFVSLILQVLGSLFLVSGIIFFFAFNWAEMHKFVKLGVLAGGLLMTAGVAYWRKLDRLSGKVALTVAAVLAGALLAVYGQIYQTGADSYELFLLWAGLITLWVIIGRFSPLWAFWIVLLNLGIIFYWIQTRGEADATLYLVLFLLNGGGLLASEFALWRGINWLQNRWVPRFLCLATLASLTIPATLFLTQAWTSRSEPLSMVLTVLFFAASVVMLVVYSYAVVDPFVILVSAGGLILVTNAWILVRLEMEMAALLLTSILIILEAAVAVMWLRHLTQVRGVEAT